MKSIAFAAAVCGLITTASVTVQARAATEAQAPIPVPPVAHPGRNSAQASALETCLVKSLTAQDETHIRRWFVLNQTKHPDLVGQFTISPATEQTIHSNMGKLFVRLLNKDCLTEAQAAVKVGGYYAVGYALGRAIVTPVLSEGGPIVDPTFQEGLLKSMSTVDVEAMFAKLGPEPK